MDQMINIFENEEFGSVRTMKEENGSVVFCGSSKSAAISRWWSSQIRCQIPKISST